MPDPRPFNLFVYGTLRDPSVFRAVLGRRLVTRAKDADEESYLARDAVLAGYKKVSPDKTYLYAVPDARGRIRGYLIGPLPAECLKALQHYEGRNYSRRRLTVETDGGPVMALVFVANLEQLEHSFGYEFRDPFKQEVLLRRKIEDALAETEWEKLHTTEPYARRAVAELHGRTIRDLMRRHFEAGGISNYAIRHSLLDTPLRDFSRVRGDPQARALAENYLRLVVRQVVFNQLEERIHRDFRFELDKMNAEGIYYDRTASCLAALRVLNDHGELLEKISADGLTALSFSKSHLIDFVRRAIIAADAFYDADLARQQIHYIQTHMGQGYISIGAELEFSNIGHEVIRDPDGRAIQDTAYDGFLYFTDFALDVLTWKLGGHLDDHREKTSTRPRRGFFETALGSLSIEANISKPVTSDPWLLNEFIRATRRFYPIAPHSIHISLQLRRRHRPVRDNPLPLWALKCLFALAGDPVRDKNGHLKIRRLISEEIIRAKPKMHMLFSDISLRHSRDEGQGQPYVHTAQAGGKYVQQYKFLRLSGDLNYEVIAMALKGIQVSLSPGSFLTGSQYRNSRKHRDLFESLLEWGADPQPLRRPETAEFLAHVKKGLMTERFGKPAHTKAYIAWSLQQLRQILGDFNNFIRQR